MISILSGLLVLVFFFLLAVSLYGSFQMTLIPLLATPYTPADFGWPFEEVTFPSFDGLRLKGWFVPAATPTPYTILIHHGVGSNAGDSLLNTACLYRRGKWNLFYYNFRGHDGSEGSVTSLGPLEVRDMDAALRWLQANKPAAARRIAVYGHSLGAAVAIVGAALHPELEGVVAESPFARLTDIVAHFSKTFYGIPYFPFVQVSVLLSSWRLGVWLPGFLPVKEIAKISPRPIFLIQGERDRRMPMRDAEALYAAAQQPKTLWVVPGADHGDPWIVAREEYEQRLVSYFEEIFGPKKMPL